MGGWGSGSRYGSKDTTDGYRKLDVRHLQREGCLERRYSFGLERTCKGQPRGDIRIFPDADRVTTLISSVCCEDGNKGERFGWLDDRLPRMNAKKGDCDGL